MGFGPKFRGTKYLQWLSAVLLASFLLSGLDLILADGDDGRDFFFNPDPGTKLIRLQSIGDSTGVGVSYVLYGDGRLEISRVNYKQEKTGAVQEYRLSFEEVSGLVRRVVEGGLLEWDNERIKGEMKAARGSAYIVHDGATVRLEVNLESYRSIGQTDFAPASTTIVFGNPTIVANRFPDIEEIQALAAVSLEFREYRKKAQKAQDEH